MMGRHGSVVVLWPSGSETEPGLGQFYLRAFRQLGLTAFGAPLDPVDPWTIEGQLQRRLGRHRAALDVRVRQLRDEIRHRRARLVLVIKGEELTADQVVQLRPRSGAPLVLYHPDSPVWFLRPYCDAIVESVRQYDLVLTFARSFVPVFRQIGARRVERLPFAHDPSIHRPVDLDRGELATYVTDLSYAGTTGPLQRYWLDLLGEFRPKRFGAEWEREGRIAAGLKKVRGYSRYHGRLPGYGAQLAKVCAGAKVVINFVRAEADCAHSMKTFELPACGGCVVTNRTAEQEEFFPEGYAYFDSREEAVEQIRRLLGDKSQRERLRERAILEAREHTYEARAAQLLAWVAQA